MVKISVIIPVYNTGKYLSECLDSVLEQTFTDFEIICINDGSTDGSDKILSDYAARDNRIKIITQDNSGVVAARNNGVAHATGRYIYPLDSDDIIAPTALRKMYNAIIKRRGDIITCRVMQFGKENGELFLMHPTKLNLCRANCLVNAALISRENFIRTGGYSTDCNVALEDYDLWLNCVFSHNMRIYRIPEILFYYRIKNADESRNLQHRQLHSGLMDTIYSKYPSIKTWQKIYKITNPFRKIFRSFFKIHNNTVYVFRIPVMTKS